MRAPRASAPALLVFGLLAGRAAAQPAPVPAPPQVATTDARCTRASVLVTVDGGTGSGTVIDARGLVLTNHHVVAPVFVPGFDAPSIRGRAHLRVQIPGANSLEATEVYEAEIVSTDPEIDLALVRILGRVGEPPNDALRFEHLTVADGEALPTGTRVGVLGYPFGHRVLTVLAGTITGRRVQTDGTVEWITTDAPFNPGNSGGSVVDDRCRLVGVPTQVYRGGLNPVSMARPVDARVRAYVASAVAAFEAGRTAAPAAPTDRGAFGAQPGPASTTKPPAAGRGRRGGRASSRRP